MTPIQKYRVVFQLNHTVLVDDVEQARTAFARHCKQTPQDLSEQAYVISIAKLKLDSETGQELP